MSDTQSDFQHQFKHADTIEADSTGVRWLPSRGVLRLSRFDAIGSGTGRTVHRSTYVNGRDYCGMTDNDIRGFPDGGFIWGWNQATQIHVRLGREGQFPHPKYGEVELFRVLQRWDDIVLPVGFELSACRVTLHVEEGPPRPLRLFVYAVTRDWNPGTGGENENNVSVPKPGEVWWGDAAFGREAWGLPGAGFASDTHHEADTGAHALAEASWEPGQEHVVFQSEDLAAYAADRVRQASPILLLLKLTDAQEDSPGCFFNLYSGEHGDSRQTTRRPRLDLEWSSAAEAESVAHDVFLEYGRVHEFPRQPSGVGSWTASFDAAPGYQRPVLQVREGTGDDAGPWRKVSFPFEPTAEWFQLRALAMPDPLELGDVFEAMLADTWVLTGPPESRSVRWRFESPAGAVHTVQAEYLGRYEWRVRFTPDGPGTWRYYWTQDFLPELYRSAPGEFHVWGGTLDSVVQHLAQLEEAVAGLARKDRGPLYLRLYALEREGMRLLTPDDYRGAVGQAFRARIRDVRTALWGKPVPETIPMESHQLVREVDGVELRDPIPDGSLYAPASERAPGKGSRVRRTLRRFRRVVARLRGRADTGPG